MSLQEEPAKYVHTLEYHNLDAPNEIVPVLIDLFHPSSVIDYGCGTGTFLKVFYDNQITDILGLDGEWVDKTQLFIPGKYFQVVDLEKRIPVARKFDLLLCLEVAEHIAKESADMLVDNLTALSDLIIFSSAVVNQGGQNHVNEQHFEYWVEKFKAKGFVFYDIFRKMFWLNNAVNWWYKQNMFLIVKNTINTSKFGIIEKAEEIQEYIHPDLLAVHVNALKEQKVRMRRFLNAELSARLYMKLLATKIKRSFLKSKIE